VYALDLSSKVGPEASGSMVDFRLRSDVVFRARRLPDGTTQIASQIPNASFEANDPETKAKFVKVAEELKQPFVFTLARGSLTQVRPPSGWSRFADSISRTLAAALQAARKKDTVADPWSGDEADATGAYVAELHCTSPFALTKRKLKYGAMEVGSASRAQISGKLVPEVVTSEGHVTLASPSSATPRGTTLERLDYHEQLALPLTSTARLRSETSMKLAFKRLETAAARFDWDAALTGTKPLAPSQPIRVEVIEDAYDSTRIGNYTFPKALAELEQFSKDPKANDLFSALRDQQLEPAELHSREGLFRDQGRAFAATAALLRSKPETVALATNAIRHASPARTALIDALSSAGTPQTQGVLIRLMDDTALDKVTRSEAAYALMRVAKATPEVVDALTKHVDGGELRVHALYGLGTIDRRLREGGETARAAGITQVLIQTLQKADSPAIQVHVLRGIANSGDPAALQAVRPFFTSSVDKLRTAAVDAVRLMQQPEVDGLVVGRLESDKEQSVELAALDAIAVREPTDTLVGAVTKAARSAENPVVRVKAVRVIAQLRAKRSELRAVLEQLAKDSEYEQVRKAAASALESPS
jgi:hypothetical protein